MYAAPLGDEFTLTTHAECNYIFSKYKVFDLSKNVRMMYELPVLTQTFTSKPFFMYFTPPSLLKIWVQ